MKNSEEILFYFSDLKKLYSKKRKKIWKFSCIFSASILAFLLIRSPLFEAKASFQDIGEKKQQSDLLVSLIKEEAPGVEIMKSLRVMKDVVTKLGLQAQVQNSSLITKVFRRIGGNIKAELSGKIEDIEGFRFCNVNYEGNDWKDYHLLFTSRDEFKVYDSDKKLLCISFPQEKVLLGDVSFTLTDIPGDLNFNKLYHLRLSPWIPMATSLSRQVSLESKKNNKNLIELSFLHRDRYLGKNILNQIMFEYGKYLKGEYEIFAKAQLDYLEMRQKELTSRFNDALENHIKYIETNLDEHGFLGIDQHLEFLLSPYQVGLEKLSSIDLQLKRMEKTSFSPSFLPESIGSEFKQIQHNLIQLKNNRDQLNLAHINEPPWMIKQQSKWQSRIQEIDDQLNSPKKNLKQWQIDPTLPVEAKQIAVELDLLKEEKESILTQFGPMEKKFSALQKIRDQRKDIEEQIEDLQNSTPDSFHEDMADHLHQFKHLLSVKEKMVKEQSLSDEDLSGIEAMDLETAKSLYLQYNNQCNSSEIRARQYACVAEQIKSEDFELSSLSSHLSDAISQELIHRASQIKWRLEDEKNHSPKEEVRLRDELDLHRNVLFQHIDEMIRLNALEKEVLLEKLQILQKVMVYQLNQRISIHQQQMEEYLSAHRSNLVIEKELLNGRLEHLKEQMVVLPQKWKKENELKMKTDLSLQMMKTTTNLVEERTIGHHLQQIVSKPLDSAVLPFKPKKPRLILFSLLSLFFGALLAFLFYLIRAFLNGFEISLQALQELHSYVSGEISSCSEEPDSLKDGDLETLRHASQFIKIGSITSLIGGKGPDYSHTLAQLLAKKELKVLLVDLSFSIKYSGKTEKSLLGFLEKKIKTLPIDRKNHYDFVPSGGYTKFANEYLSSHSFSKLLEDVKKRYDVVLLFTRALPRFTEAKTYLLFSDQVIVTVKGETLDEINPFIRWSHPQEDRLSFVMHS